MIVTPLEIWHSGQGQVKTAIKDNMRSILGLFIMNQNPHLNRIHRMHTHTHTVMSFVVQVVMILFCVGFFFTFCLQHHLSSARQLSSNVRPQNFDIKNLTTHFIHSEKKKTDIKEIRSDKCEHGQLEKGKRQHLFNFYLN